MLDSRICGSPKGLRSDRVLYSTILISRVSSAMIYQGVSYILHSRRLLGCRQVLQPVMALSLRAGSSSS